jgi:ribosome-associated translation inhibitor RaiA
MNGAEESRDGRRPKPDTMLITVRTKGFEAEPRTRRYVESRLLSAIGQFRTRIKSVTVSLDASRDRRASDRAVSEISVHLRPSGGVRSRAEHSEMRVAVDGSIAQVRSELEREIARIARTVGPAKAIERSHHNALDVMFDDNRISHHQRELLERPENYLRGVRVRERWRSHRDVDDDIRQRKAARDREGSKSTRPRRSRRLSRVD